MMMIKNRRSRFNHSPLSRRFEFDALPKNDDLVTNRKRREGGGWLPLFEFRIRFSLGGPPPFFFRASSRYLSINLVASVSSNSGNSTDSNISPFSGNEKLAADKNEVYERAI